jgi:hypothetical protein
MTYSREAVQSDRRSTSPDLREDCVHGRCAGSLRELGAQLGWRPETLIWMLYAYFDESGEHDKTTGRLVRLTMGGALGTFAMWQAFETDLSGGVNFLDDKAWSHAGSRCGAIVTNPPYGLQP